MPQATWPQPVSPVTSLGYEEEREPRGLFGFMGGGSDFGAEIGPRLGVISQILMGLGSGRGPGDVAGALSEINERSAARRERRKAERMVGRAADKIEERDPELAAMMRGNLEFGMQILGKKYTQQYETEGAIARAKALLPGELEKESAMAKLRGEEARKTKQAELEFKAEEQRRASADLMAQMGLLATPSTTTATNGEQPPVTPDTVSPITIAPDSTQPAPVTAEPVPTIQPIPQTEQPPLSSDPSAAELQRRLMKRYGIKVYATDADSLWAEIQQGNKAEVHVILRAIQARDVEEKRAIRDQTFQREQADTAYQREADKPNVLEAEFLAQQRPEIAPTVSKTPLDQLAVLREAGMSDQDIELMGGADVAYNTIISGVRGGPGAEATMRSELGDDLRAARKAQAEAGDTTRAGVLVQQQVQRIKSTIKPDLRTGQFTVPQEQAIAGLDVILAGDPKNAPKALDDWRKTQGAAADELIKQTVSLEQLELAKQEAAAKRADEAAKRSQAEVATGEAERAVLNRAFDAKRQLKRVMALVTAPGNREVIHNAGGWIESFVPGTSRSRIEAYVKSLESILATDYIQGMKKQSVNGATGLGNTNQEEIEIAKTMVVALRDALQNGTDTEYALKRLHNYFNNMIMPDGGERFDEDAPGLVLEPFNMEKHNPALFIQQQRNNTITDESTGITVSPNQ